MDTLLQIGLTWNIFLQSLGTWLKTPMLGFSFLGNEYFFLFLLPALYWCFETGTGIRVGVLLLLSTALNDALKMFLHGPCPYWVSPHVTAFTNETSFGAPSGHAQIAASVWGMLASRLHKWWGWLIAILVILLIGISRIYLGVHLPQDVILGWLIGAFLLWLVIRFWTPVSVWVKKMSLGRQILVAFLSSLVLIIFPLLAFLWLKVTNWQAPQAWAAFSTLAVSLSGAFTTGGTLFGLLAGLAWLNKQGGFLTAGPLLQRVLRFLLGLLGVLILYLGLKVVFGFIAPDGETLLPLFLRYIRYTLVGAWVSAFAPWLFIKFKMANKAS